jgi:hypothetical protein
MVCDGDLANFPIPQGFTIPSAHRDLNVRGGFAARPQHIVIRSVFVRVQDSQRLPRF